jgi:glycosyltransferase involved in cell wall biosynthesis
VTRILFLDHAPIVGGAQLALIEHIAHLDRKAFTALVACGDSIPALTARFEAAGAVVHRFSWPRLRGLTPFRLPQVAQSALRLRRLARQERVDLVVANTSRTAYLAAIALTGSGVPLVWWVRDFDFGQWLFRILRRSSARIICVSNAIREFYGGSGDPRYEVVYVGSGMHARLDAVDESRVVAERQRWGLSDSDVVIGYMGRLVEGKGAQDLIEAVAELVRDIPRLRLLVVGTGRGQDGDVEQRLHELVKERGLVDFVRFAGFQSDEALYYRLFDVFVLSSRYREAMPTSVIQAMMAGRPVVATSTGGTPEVVIDGETGMLVRPNDSGALAAALRRLVSDAALTTKLTTAALSRVTAHHREEIITGRVESIYRAITRSLSANVRDSTST